MKIKKCVSFQANDEEIVPKIPSGQQTEEAKPEAAPPFELSREDVVAAFEFFDSMGSGVLTTSSLKARLSAFVPNLTSKEYRFLLESPNGSGAEGSDFTADTLWELIDTYQQQFYRPARSSTSSTVAPGTPKSTAHSIAVASTLDAVSRFDPVKESFQVYDPHGTGHVDVQMLGSIMTRIGFGELSDEELAILVRTADFDQDGHINLDDFRHLVSMKGRFMKHSGDKEQPL